MGSIADIKGFSRDERLQCHQGRGAFLCEDLDQCLRERRIRVNVLSPGLIDTAILEDPQQGEALLRMKKEMDNNVPLGRFGDPDEIAKAVSFLPSNEASYVPGAEL